MATIEEQYNNRMAESQGKVNSLYDTQLAAQKQQLQSAYDQSLSDQQYAKDQIAPQFRQSANTMATQYERNKRNLNMQALQNGLNTGTNSQQQLAMNNVWQKNYAALQGQRAQSLAAADKGIADLKTNYQNQMSQAIADNDYKRAAALLDDYNNNQAWLETSAKNLAAMGDFSGYALLYGQPQADAMRQTWIASNPDLAWNLKLIDAAEYKRMTGKDAPGTVAKSAGAYYAGSSSSSNNNKNNTGGLNYSSVTKAQQEAAQKNAASIAGAGFVRLKG